VAGTKLRFVVSLITEDNDYQREQASAAQQAAGILGVDLQVCFANNDAIEQSMQILNAIQTINARVDGILVEPASRTAFPKVAHAAAASGIAWVVLNAEAEYLKELRLVAKVPVFSVGADNQQVGRIQGQQLAALLPCGGCVLYIQGPSNSSVVEPRAAGMLETKPEGVSIKTLKSANWTEDGGYRTVSSWLSLSTSRNERIDAVQGQNDFLAMGARRALEHETAGEERESRIQVPFLGVDGLANTGQAWVRQGSLTATVVVPPTAGQALETLVGALGNQSQPPEQTLVSSHSLPELKALAAKANAPPQND
jgi:ribose transport system substrate-binding protein